METRVEPVLRPSFATRLYDALQRRRRLVLILLLLGVGAGILGATKLPVDMSFRPTFISNKVQVERTREHERVFGQVGFRDLVAIVDVGSASQASALEKVALLADRLGRLPSVIDVRDPAHFPFFDGAGTLHPQGIVGSLPAGARLDSPAAEPLIADLLRSPSARRIVVGDGDRRIAVTASIDIPNEAFARRREAVAAFRQVVAAWSAETGLVSQVTGYPEVEQVYAHEVLFSVFRSIAALLLLMMGILFVYFRRLTDVVTCLAGVTLAVPVVLGSMALLGQPFSIVNSQVLTLVLIVGIGQALHHQEEYRRRREAGRGHVTANREAFSILAWPSFMTGFATLVGFAALLSADMRAIWSFGLSTALGVAIVYAINWLVVPVLIQLFYRDAHNGSFFRNDRSLTLAIVRGADELLQSRPGLVALGFVVVTVLLATFGMSGLSIDQRVNEELSTGHPAVRAETTYEREFAGFLGPELAVRPASNGEAWRVSELTAFVNRLCEMPEVRYVASPLDFLAQPSLPPGPRGKACRRESGELGVALAARQGAAGPALQRLATGVISADAERAAIVVRVADIGTAKSLPFVERVQRAARETMPHARVEPVGQWWLAQQGMNRLSFDVMFSAVTALFVILPIMWFAIRDKKLFLAAIPPTILPVFATLGFMGLAHITVRIGTAMILAIALGLAADDTIHLSVRIRDRVRLGCDPASAVTATLLRTGRPCSFSSYVLIGGFASMLTSSLLALQAMGLIAMFTMAFALATDLVLGPALYLLLAGSRKPISASSPSLSALLADVVQNHPERPAISYRLPATAGWGSGQSPRVRTLSWHELVHCVLRVADTLDRRLGSVRIVAVLSDTDARYPLLELAVALTGRTLQPLYVTASDDDLRRALATTDSPGETRMARAQVLLVGRSQVQRARRAELGPPVIELHELVDLPGVDGAAHEVLPAAVEPFDARAVRERLLSLRPRPSTAPLLYLQSTGTTGPARVIEIGELALLQAVCAVQGEASHPFPRLLSFLPTAHVSERLLTVYLSLAVAGHTFYGGGIATLAEDLRACRPTVLLAPPLLLETLQGQAVALARGSAVGRWLLASVQRSASAKLANGIVGGARAEFRACCFGWQLRRQSGLDQVRDFLAGAAPVSAALHAWCEAVGMPLRIVYGQTELSGATSISARTGATFGAVGVPVAGVELRISEQGELLVRSAARFTRYVADAAATSDTLAYDWLHTGDRARLLPTGEVLLLGRVQAVLEAEDGTVVDTAEIGALVHQTLGRADLVFPRVSASAAYLYVGLHQTPRAGARAAEIQLVPEADPRWRQVARVLEAADPHRLVRGFALFDGAFQQATDEVGPTGKPRGHRIHELRREQIQIRGEGERTCYDV